jgi:hypothetical protein
MCCTYFLISENTLLEMLSNRHEFVSELGTIDASAVKVQNTFSVL